MIRSEIATAGPGPLGARGRRRLAIDWKGAGTPAASNYAATATMALRPRSSAPPRSTRSVDDEGRDRALGVALQRGDAGAIERLYERYARTVLAYLLSRLEDRASAEDVHQQVFAELWRRAGEYDPERAKLFTWVMLVTRSRATDHQRRSVPEPHEPSRAAAMIDQRHDAEEPVDEMLERWRVADLLRRVPTEQAEILRLRFYEGLSQREIAARTETPLGTVKMRMVQALNQMRTLIVEEGV